MCHVILSLYITFLCKIHKFHIFFSFPENLTKISIVTKFNTINLRRWFFVHTIQYNNLLICVTLVQRSIPCWIVTSRVYYMYCKKHSNKGYVIRSFCFWSVMICHFTLNEMSEIYVLMGMLKNSKSLFIDVHFLCYEYWVWKQLRSHKEGTKN